MPRVRPAPATPLLASNAKEQNDSSAEERVEEDKEGLSEDAVHSKPEELRSAQSIIDEDQLAALDYRRRSLEKQGSFKARKSPLHSGYSPCRRRVPKVLDSVASFDVVPGGYTMETPLNPGKASQRF